MSIEKVLWRVAKQEVGSDRTRGFKNIPVVYKYLSCARHGMFEYTIHMGIKSNLHASIVPAELLSLYCYSAKLSFRYLH